MVCRPVTPAHLPHPPDRRPHRLVDPHPGADRGAGQPDEFAEPAKAPWYFLGFQEMLVYFDPWMAGVVCRG